MESHKSYIDLLKVEKGTPKSNMRNAIPQLVRAKMRVVPTSVSDVGTTSLADVIKTLPQRYYNVATILSIGFLDHFTTGYSDFSLHRNVKELQKY